MNNYNYDNLLYYILIPFLYFNMYITIIILGNYYSKKQGLKKKDLLMYKIM